MVDEVGIESRRTNNAARVRVAGEVKADPTHPEYTADRAVSIEIAGGKSGLIAAIDGVGSGGEKSAKAAEIVRKNLASIGTKLVEIPDFRTAEMLLKDEIFRSRNEIRELQKGVGGNTNMDTTVSAAILCKSGLKGDKETYLLTANVGDSRVYRYRPSTGRVEQLTKDDSYVQEMIDQGKISEKEAFSHPDRNVITKSVGGLRAPKEIGIMINAVEEGDVYFAVSDGVGDNVPALESAVIDEFRKSYDPKTGSSDVKKLASGLAQRAMNIQVEGKARHAKSDDTTVAVMQIPRRRS